MQLEEKEKRELLRIARSSIESALRRLHEETDAGGLAGLQEPRGVFVTLRRDGELRGCIGYVEARLPLVDAVKEVAAKAATEDPRFLPLSPRELASTQIEISVLSPLSRVDDPQAIEVGKHGLVIDAGFARGLLLPGVPLEYNWTREEFLNHTAMKAGLPPEIWQTGQVKIFTFTTETFSDSELHQVH
jgi:AmmeMemoRadiSam system protein A